MQIEYEHARMLREGLARVHKLVPPQIQNEIVTILKKYGQAVHAYCDCPHKVFHPFKQVHVCIDCGRGYQEKIEK